ncbi:MAG TPA: hypothetical protein VMZ26_16375 [Pyrinomonadaceae bacterium]|nr:hypothetical protein [Pyrinomonadaceae bacterium]
MRKLEKKTLDEIAKALVKADAPSPRDIEGIIANPALFDSVRARVKLAANEPAPKPFLFFGRTAMASFASVALVGIIVFALLAFNTKSPDMAAVPVPETPGHREVTKKFDRPDRVAAPDLPRTQTSVRADRASSRADVPDVPEVKISRPRRSAAQQIRYEGEGDFYALSYAGDPNETERGGRIVRVDIPRSTLFAMGVDVPLENESETVKADLLIGSDGVTRAIRVVK